MPITNVPVDQGAFTRMMVVSVTPKLDRETGAQFTSKDGSEKKWTVEVVASMASRFDANRSDTEVLAVTVTTAADPTQAIHEGEQVRFDGFTAGVMPPEPSESGRIRGGKLFWMATGVHSHQLANVGKRGE